MELKQLTDETLKLFDVPDTSNLSEKMLEIELNNDFSYYAKFKELVDDLSVDWLQKIFQYYEADRKEKMQDYTPRSLAKFVGRLTQNENEKIVFDLCAGSGALTIQKWNLNHNLEFICYEYDEKVIPFLLFNLAVRNINATVIHGNALSDEVFATYKVTSTSDFSRIAKVDAVDIVCDTAISNPPYNMKWIEPPFAQLQSRFANCEIPPESNANYAFILTALDKVKYRAAMILPNAVLSTDIRQEKEIRKYLIESNYVESVILCPDKMFEATSIATCILVLSKTKTTRNIAFVDMRQQYTVEQREQNGQYGGASHTNRTYKKDIKTFSDEQIDKAIQCIHEHIDEAEYSRTVQIDEIRENDYILVPSRYIDFENREYKHRDFADIMNDINRIEREKSVLKLTLNESLAKSLGFDKELYNQEENTAKELNKSFELVGGKYEFRKYITFSKNKNEFKIENQDKEILSSILKMVLPMWKQHIYYLNEEQNRLLAEFRDALLPELMSGNIEV
ncbi:MAG: N-6 DNA methylase [Clostridia bacterium]|nr:N-6 DNA methylase [Clostridia bacterium]